MSNDERGSGVVSLWIVKDEDLDPVVTSSPLSKFPEYLIAGLGSVGRRHLRNLLSVGVGSIRLLRTFQSTLPEAELAGFPVETDLAAALTRKPAAVIIANPTARHLDVAIPAAAAGCHLLIEKPLSHSLDGIRTLAAAARESGARVLTGFQFRFHPGLRLVRDLLHEGAIGSLVEVAVHWGEFLPDWHPWEDYRLAYSARSDLGGGVLLTLCHPFDYLRWLVGEIAEVSAAVSCRGELGIDVEDTAEVTLQFAGGVPGRVHLDYLQRPPSHRMRITGLKGTIDWDGMDGMVRLTAAGTGREQVFPAPESFERNTMFLEEMRHFSACVEGVEEPLCTLDDGIQVLRIALAAKQSALEGEPVRIPPVGVL